MAKIRPGGQKMARRAAKQPPAGKPKLSRVTSGYGGLMISLDTSDPKKWGLYGCSVEKWNWEKLRSSGTKRATGDRLVPQ